MDDVVEVLDLEIKTDVPGLTLYHTVRTHEGDRIGETPERDIRIIYGDKQVVASGEKVAIKGREVTIPASHIVEMTTIPRLEPKVRPSAKLLVDRDAAEVAALAEKLGANS